MKSTIPIYKAEANDGLTEQIRKNNSIAYCVPVMPAKVDEKNLKQFLSIAQASDEFNLDILYPTKSVLVSSTWNKNGDVFGVAHLWNARHTPDHQYTNINHDHTQIVGHITNTWVIDAEGNTIDEDTLMDDLPDYIHICNGAVIYRHYKEEDLEERAEDLIAEIEAGNKYVSMECLFKDFDYAVIDSDGNNYIVARNEETSFLTKHLRSYGGDGEFNGYKLGRYIKNMIFSGKGYVDKPANQESVIFTDEKPDFNFSAAKCKSGLILKNGVNINSHERLKLSNATPCNSKENIMSDNNDFYKSQLEDALAKVKALTEKNEALVASVANANVDQLNAKIESLTTQIEALTEEKLALAKKSEEAVASVDTLTVSLKELAESKEALEKAVQEAKAEKLFADRVALFVDAGLDREAAETATSKFSGLNDEQFTEIVDVYAKSLFGEMKRESEAQRDADPKMSETDEVLSNKGFAAEKMADEKKKKAKKDDSAACSDTEAEEALSDAEVNEDTNDVGAAEADDESDSVKVIQSMASYFAGALGQSDETKQ